MQEKKRSSCFKTVLKFQEATKISLTITQERLVMGYKPAGASPTAQSTHFKISKAEVAVYLLVKTQNGNGNSVIVYQRKESL